MIYSRKLDKIPNNGVFQGDFISKSSVKNLIKILKFTKENLNLNLNFSQIKLFFTIYIYLNTKFEIFQSQNVKES